MHGIIVTDCVVSGVIVVIDEYVLVAATGSVVVKAIVVCSGIPKLARPSIEATHNAMRSISLLNCILFLSAALYASRFHFCNHYVRHVPN